MNLFTVEQLELVRRLRLTGMSANSILEAYRSFDQIEKELKVAQVPANSTEATSTSNSKSHSPATSTASQLVPLLQTPFSSVSTANSDQINSASVEHLDSPALQQIAKHENSQCRALTVPESCLFGGSLVSTGLPTTQNQSNPECQLTPGPDSSSIAVTATQTHSFTTDEHFRFPMTTTTTNLTQSRPDMSQQPPLISSSNTLGRPLRSTQHNLRTGLRSDFVLENFTELEKFMQRGEEYCISEMKKFISQYSLRQTTVAQMTGVSQPYISKLLNGNHRELSLRCRRNIYSWFLNCRRHPGNFTCSNRLIFQLLLAIYCQDPTTRLETNGDGELMPQRRERYVFRPILIRILEAYFADSPFPDAQKRVEISQACNNALQAEKKGLHLMPKEVVTPQVIANWFANKRKEMRRKSNEENRPRNLMNGAQKLSDITSTPSPSDSSTANAESPITTMFPNGLLAPLQFAQNPSNLLSMFFQHQQQQSISMENFFETQLPMIPFNSTLPQSLLQNSLSEMNFQNTDKSALQSSLNDASLQLHGFVPSQLNASNQPQTLNNVRVAVNNASGTAQEDTNSVNMPPPPVLCSMNDDRSDVIDEHSNQSPKPLKLMTDKETENSDTTVSSNPHTYSDLLQKMFGQEMINLIQQQISSPLVSSSD